MIKVENITVSGWEAAIRGMRNPMNSWHKSDSTSDNIGENDLALMRRLVKGGSEHRKFLRMIHVSMDIVCHHIWWAEFDTYKIGVTRNSCSKMHRIHAKELLPMDFSWEGLSEVGGLPLQHWENTLVVLEILRTKFNQTGEKKYWRALLELLPMGFNIRATIDMNYENIYNIIHQREGHKVDEWREFVEILQKLPYVDEIM